jgi:hypothetical protein
VHGRTGGNARITSVMAVTSCRANTAVGGGGQRDLLAVADAGFDGVERVGLLGWHSDLGEALSRP